MFAFVLVWIGFIIYLIFAWTKKNGCKNRKKRVEQLELLQNVLRSSRGKRMIYIAVYSFISAEAIRASVIFNTPEMFAIPTQDIGAIISSYSVVVIVLLLFSNKIMEAFLEKTLIVVSYVLLLFLLAVIMVDHSFHRALLCCVGLVTMTTILEMSAMSLLQKTISDPLQDLTKSYVSRNFFFDC